MSVRDFLVQEFAFQTRHDHSHLLESRRQINRASLVNFIRILAITIPIANTIMGIMGLVNRNFYDGTLRLDYLSHWPERWNERIGRIVTCSFCIASLGILLIPLMIAATIMKSHGQRLTNRNVKPIGPDYLL